jgi:hypothetical protein
MSTRSVLLLTVVAITASAVAQEQRRIVRSPNAEPRPQLTPAQKKQQQEWKKQFITRAASTAKDLSSSDRAFLLARLADASAKSEPAQAKAWAEEAFQLSGSMPQNMQRGQTVMQSVLAVSKIDTDRAMQMLAQIEPPPAANSSPGIPDIRDPISTMAFQAQWKKNGVNGLDAIQATAHQLGESGFYPYMAITPIIRQAAAKDKERAATLAQDALNFLNTRRTSTIETQHVAGFIRSAAEFMPAAVIKETIAKLVKDAGQTKDEGLEMHAEIADDKGNRAEFGARGLMLMQLLPVVRRIDREWADKLVKENAELQQLAAQAENGPAEMRVTARIGGPGDDDDNGPPRDMREEMNSMEVDQLAARDPQQALKISNEINDPVLRAASHAKIAGELNRTDPQEAAALLRSAREAMAQATLPRDKLMIIAGLAQAQAAMKDMDGLADTLKRGIAMGEEIFRKGVDKRPNAPVFAQPGYELMGRLVATAAKADPVLAASRIDEIRTPILQAMMLVNAAKAVDPDGGALDGAGVMIQIED